MVMYTGSVGRALADLNLRSSIAYLSKSVKIDFLDMGIEATVVEAKFYF